MNVRSQKKLGEILIEKKLLTHAQLAAALTEQARTKEFLGTVLVRTHQIKERDLLVTLSAQFDMPVIDLKNKYIDWKVVKRFSSTLIIDLKCFPIEENDSGVTLAVINPLDAWVLAKAQEEAKGTAVTFALVGPSDMEDAIQRYKQYLRGSI
ncbi:MAG: hypothetical protein PHV55_02425 [Candidatus Omnitrophica bacterium]|nr:hypothetical protein [Candidatus Omnitrophota bacterium]